MSHTAHGRDDASEAGGTNTGGTPGTAGTHSGGTPGGTEAPGGTGASGGTEASSGSAGTGASGGTEAPRGSAGTGTPERGAPGPGLLRLMLRDRGAVLAACTLTLVAVAAVTGPWFMGELATRQNLDAVGTPPFQTDQGWAYVLGSDSLGRSMLARLVVATRTTLSVAVPAVLISLVAGSVWGMWAGYHRGRRETVSMRIADVILSFPSLLLAVVVLYVFSPSAANIVAILAIARIPVYLRTARAESAELQSRLFVDAARTFGTRSGAIIRRHVLPTVLPTLLTVATVDFCFVMLSESSLSFLGIGIQPPDMSWGLMTAQGRQYLQTSWWISIFPGLAIVVTTVSASVLAAWFRLATDPAQRRLLALPRRKRTSRRHGTSGRSSASGTSSTSGTSGTSATSAKEVRG